MKPTVMNVLMPKRESYHMGRGEYSSRVVGFYEEKVVVDMDAFYTARETFTRYHPGCGEAETSVSVVEIDITKGSHIRSFYVTHEEFFRLFNKSFCRKAKEPRLIYS